MEKRDFLFHYTNIFFSEVVKETILIENWKEKDFDHRYIEYADVFLKIKDKCFSDDFTSEEDTINYLTERKNHIVGLFNSKMYAHFINDLKDHGYNKNSAERLIPEDILNNETININTLKNFRDIEERLFDNEQGEI